MGAIGSDCSSNSAAAVGEEEAEAIQEAVSLSLVPGTLAVLLTSALILIVFRALTFSDTQQSDCKKS